jgi:hypothetical protein
MKPPPVISKARKFFARGRQLRPQHGPHHLFQVFARREAVQPHAVGDARGGLQHHRAYRGHRDRDHRQPLRSGRKLRRHQREIVVPAFEVQLRAGFPSAPDGAQRLDILAQPRRRCDPGHAEPPLVVRFHLAAQSQHEAAVGMALRGPTRDWQRSSDCAETRWRPRWPASRVRSPARQRRAGRTDRAAVRCSGHCRSRLPRPPAQPGRKPASPAPATPSIRALWSPPARPGRPICGRTACPVKRRRHWRRE